MSYSSTPPDIEPDAPIISNPVALTATKELKAVGTFTNRTAAHLALPYKVKDAYTIDGLHISDHALTDCGGLLRVYAGRLLNTVIERIAHTQGKYVAGVAASVFQSANAEVRNLTIRNVTYDSAQPITSPGDIYGGITLAGKTADDIGSDFLFENIKMSNLWAQYTGYENRDGIVFEAGYTDGLIRWCDIRHGSDAGIDRKGINWRVEDTIIEDFRENFKTWVSSHDGAVYSFNPRFAHFLNTSLDTSTTEHIIDFACLRGSDPSIPIVKFERAPGILRLLESDLTGLPEGQVLAKWDPEAAGSKLIIGDQELVFGV